MRPEKPAAPHSNNRGPQSRGKQTTGTAELSRHFHEGVWQRYQETSNAIPGCVTESGSRAVVYAKVQRDSTDIKIPEAGARTIAPVVAPEIEPSAFLGMSQV